MKKLKEEKELESNETECGTLMVYGIPGNLQKKGLENLFCVFGEIIYIDLNRPGGNDKSCSITMETLQQALSAQRSLNKAPPFFLNIRIKKGNGAFTKSVGSTSTVNPAVVHQISTVNPAVVHQISTIGPAVVDPTTTIDTAVVDPTITIDPAVVDPATTIDAVVDPTTTIDPAVVDPTTTIDPAVVNPTTTIDPAVVDPSTTIDTAVVDPTTTIDPAVVNPTTTIDPADVDLSTTIDTAVVDPIYTIDPAVVNPTTTVDLAVVNPTLTIDPAVADPASTVYLAVVDTATTIDPAVVNPATAIDPALVDLTNTVYPAILNPTSAVNQAVVDPITTIDPAVVDPTSAVDQAVVDPITTIDPAVVDPTTTINPAVVDPTNTIDPAISNQNSVVDQAVVDPITTIDPAVVDPTSAVDPAVVDSNTTIDPAVVDPTTTINPAVVDPTSTIDPAISNQNSAVDEAVVDPIITIDPAVVDPTTTINPAVVDQISTLYRDGVDPTPLDAGKQDSESRKSRKISEVEKEMDADTAANQLSALVILEEQISSDEEFYSFDSEEEETFSSSKGDEVIDPPTLDIQRPLPPAPSPPIKPLNFENERTEVQIIDGSDFPEVFYVMPAALANEKKRIELLLSAINRYDLENIKPRLKTSVLVEYSDRLYRANVIRIDHVYRWAQVELVDEGGLVDVSWDLCFSPLDRLWAEPSLAATVGLFIPEDELWPEKFNKQILSLISLEKIFVYVVPVVRVAGQLLVSIILERRISKDIFAVIEDINTFRCAEDVISTHGDSDTGPAQGQGTDGVVDYTEHPLFFLEPPVAAGSEPMHMVPLEDFSDPPLAKSAPPEKHIHQDSECCRDAGINFSVLITDLEHTKVHDGASYLFIGFGEWSNIIYLVPMYDNISGSDFARLDSVLLESGLQPAIDRELEVGEVLVVPRQFYNRTKYIRAEVLKIYPSDPEKTVKIRGIDAQYRSIEKMVNLRPLTPDALLYPVKAIKVVLNNVSKHPRATFKPLISDLTSQMLNEPMIVHVIEPGNVPVVNLLSEVLPPVSLNLLVEDDLNDGKQTPGNPAPEPPAALLVEFGDDYEDVARAFIDLHKDSFCKIEVGSIGVVILHSESPDLVGFMPLDRALELEKCLEKYRQLASGTKFIDDQPEVGKVYLSRGKDGAWYRAAVLSLDKHQAKMLFLDFGFIEKVAATSLKLYNSDGLKFLTNFCRVENWNDDPLEEDWTCNKKSAANTRLRPLAKLKALEVECPPENQLQVVAVESPPGPADQLLVVAAEGSNTGGDDGGDLPQDRAELQRQRASRKREIRRQLPVWSPRVVEVLDTPGPLYTIRI